MSQRGQMGEIWSRSDGLDGLQTETERCESWMREVWLKEQADVDEIIKCRCCAFARMNILN